MNGNDSTPFKPCLELQQIIDNFEPATRVRQETPVFNFLKSPENVKASGVDIPLDQFNGKYASADKKGLVKFSYFPEVCDLPSNDVRNDWCSAIVSTNGDTGEVTREFNTDLHVNFDIVLDYDGQHDVCYDVNKVEKILIDARRRAKLTELEKVVTESMLTTMGKYAGQTVGNSLTNPYTLNVINQYSQYNPGAIAAMQNEFYKKLFNGRVKYFGDVAGYLAIAANNQAFAAPNTGAGTDASKIALDFDGVFGFNTYSGLTAGSDHAIGVPLGAYRLIEYYDNQGDYNQGKDGFLPGRTSYRTIMELWGEEWDVKVTRTDCKDHFFFQKRMGVLPVPNGLCQDKLALHFLTGCGVFDCTALAPFVSIVAA